MSEAPALLLVEDDPHIRLFVSELLKGDGYSVIEAADGEAAIAVLRQHQPPVDGICLVILDMMLPDASGIDVLRTLAELGNYTPVIAMSADRQQLRRAIAAGADETLYKPFDLDRLMETVERVCHP